MIVNLLRGNLLLDPELEISRAPIQTQVFKSLPQVWIPWGLSAAEAETQSRKFVGWAHGRHLWAQGEAARRCSRWGCSKGLSPLSSGSGVFRAGPH